MPQQLANAHANVPTNAHTHKWSKTKYARTRTQKQAHGTRTHIANDVINDIHPSEEVLEHSVISGSERWHIEQAASEHIDTPYTVQSSVKFSQHERFLIIPQNKLHLAVILRPVQVVVHIVVVLGKGTVGRAKKRKKERKGERVDGK